MRFVVYGAGAIGGVVGGRLAEAGHDVVLIARGAHGEQLRRSGLVVRSPDGSVTLPLDVASHPDEVDFRVDDVVLLAVKSQDSPGALAALAARAPDVAVVCLQNGVANEREALRRFADVYAVPVMCPTVHLEPGVVDANSAPVTGILDIGRYPQGRDDTCERVAAAFGSATFVAEVRPDVMRWKWAKLMLNLANAVEAVCGPSAELAGRVIAEGRAVLEAAGIDAATAEEDRARRGDLLRIRPIAGERRGGGSSWQSLARGATTVETDHLNGEIVLLGRLHGVATPANEVLRRLANAMARSGARPATMSESDVLRAVKERSDAIDRR